MRFDVFTLFPDVFGPYLDASILQRARARELVEIHVHNIRDWATDVHKMTDDEPYGGGGGMVMKPEPIFRAVEDVAGAPPDCPIVLLTPQGRTFTQSVAGELATLPRIALICSRSARRALRCIGSFAFGIRPGDSFIDFNAGVSVALWILAFRSNKYLGVTKNSAPRSNSRG